MWRRFLRVGHLNLFTGVFYRSPVSSYTNDEALLSVFRAIGDIQTYDKCLIMGDFNLPNVDLANFCVNGPSDSFPGKVFDFYKITFGHGSGPPERRSPIARVRHSEGL